MLAFSGVFMCSGVPYGKAKISLGRKFFGFSRILTKETLITKGQFLMSVRRRHCRMSLCFLQVLHQCNIPKPECYIRVQINLHINKYLRNKNNIYKTYNLGVQDLAWRYKRQQLICSRNTDKSF
uniref:Secreted protein n=1 Tax=Strongyloides papillosus TaxID=174720 RepID=A0A0N5CCI2_STREA